jgi:hypothetical protein
MALSGLFVHRLTVGEDSAVLASMALGWGYEADTAVTVLVVVALHELLHPDAGRLQAGKALGGIGRTILAGAKQRLGIGIIVGSVRGRLYEVLIPSRYSVSNKVSPFMGLPLSACRTKGWSMHCSASTARRTTSAA